MLTLSLSFSHTCVNIRKNTPATSCVWPAVQMRELETLMAAACAFIDVVGCYGAQFTPDQHKRALAKRADVDAARAKSAVGSEEAVDRALALRQKKGQERAVQTPPPPSYTCSSACLSRLVCPPTTGPVGSGCRCRCGHSYVSLTTLNIPINFSKALAGGSLIVQPA